MSRLSDLFALGRDQRFEFQGALLLDPANEKLLDDFAAGKPIGDNSNFAGDSKMQCDEQLGEKVDCIYISLALPSATNVRF